VKAYLDILRHILDNGTIREDRTGVGTIGVFGHQARFDLRAGFPLLTTKRIPFSIDAFLGLPFNIASYALLTHMMAASTGLTVGELVISFGDLHIYRNHLEQVSEQLSRAPSGLPTLRVFPTASILDIRAEHISLENYHPQSAIPAPVAV